jgi:hypothetical protein
MLKRGNDQAGIRAEYPLLFDNKMLLGVITMIRTQISLSEEEFAAAKAEAQRLGISLAELVRRSLRNLLPAEEEKPWMRYAGFVQTGDPESSRRVDEIVYGSKD